MNSGRTECQPVLSLVALLDVCERRGEGVWESEYLWINQFYALFQNVLLLLFIRCGEAHGFLSLIIHHFLHHAASLAVQVWQLKQRTSINIEITLLNPLPPTACLQRTRLHWCYMVLCAQASEILIQTLIYKLSSIHLQFWEYLYSMIASHASVLPVLLAEQRCRSWTWPQREHIYEKAPFSKTEFLLLSSLDWFSWCWSLGPWRLVCSTIPSCWSEGMKRQKLFIFPGLVLGILCLSHRKKTLESNFDNFLNVSKIWTWIKGITFISNHFT